MMIRRALLALLGAVALFATYDLAAAEVIRQPGTGMSGAGGFVIESPSSAFASSLEGGTGNGRTALGIDDDPDAKQPGRVEVCKVVAINGLVTPLVSTDLLRIPANGRPTRVELYYTQFSNAASTGIVSIGISPNDGGAGTEFFSSTSVRNTGASVLTSAVGSTKLYQPWSTTTFTRVSGFYTSTGSAATSAGPFNIRVCYFQP